MNRMLSNLLCFLGDKYKKIIHRHKYTILKMYPPRPKYDKMEWGFLQQCECGHVKLTKLPRTIEQVIEVQSTELIQWEGVNL